MKKGQEQIGGVFSVLITVVIAGIALQYILPGQALKITPEVEAVEFENKAILLANSLLANSDLIYSDTDTNTYYRGIFDGTKFDDIFYKFNPESNIEYYRCGNDDDIKNCIPSTYPETFALIVVVDLENENAWFTGTSRLSGSEQRVLNIVSCFQARGTVTHSEMFQPNSNIAEVLGLDNCNLQRYSGINLGFPVAIRYSDSEIHNGMLKVLVVE